MINPILTENYDHVNTGKGPSIQIIDIGHNDFNTLIEADTAFWALLPKESAQEILYDRKIINSFNSNKELFKHDIERLRFGLTPSAVYFNPTDLCNLNCQYCYIPEDLRKNGQNMPQNNLLNALEKLKIYFTKTITGKRKPQIIFHGSEPLMNKESVFHAIKKYSTEFDFGIQTNATLLDKHSTDFLIKHNCSIGISIDGHKEAIADQNRKNWENKGFFNSAVNAMKMLAGYNKFSVICTLTKENIQYATDIIDFFHRNSVEICLLNLLRCTQPNSRSLRPDEDYAARYFINALDHSYNLYQKTGRKIIIANFANIILSIVAPGARRLMCDISPCGGGRCFFAVSAKGNVYPCSEFIGLEDFNCGNIFTESIEDLLNTEGMKQVTSRMTENITPCNKCAIRHFCGSPCPAEAFSMNGGRDTTGAFCRFYEEQVRYAFRLIADDKFKDFIYDNWDKDTTESYHFNE